MFSGLMSRCTTPRRWACSRARQIWMPASSRLRVAQTASGVELAEGLAFDVLADQKGARGLSGDLEDGHDMRMAELRRRPGLAQRPPVDVGLILDHLDRHLTPQLQVVGKVHGGERTAPEFAEQTVAIVQERVLVGHTLPSISPLRRATVAPAHRATPPPAAAPFCRSLAGGPVGNDAILPFVWGPPPGCLQDGRVAELADALGSGPSERKLMGVQVPPRPLPAPSRDGNGLISPTQERHVLPR